MKKEAFKFFKVEDFLGMTNEAVIVTNRAHEIVVFNNAAEHIFGYRAEDMLGKPLEVLIPQQYHQNHYISMENFASTPESKRMMANRPGIRGVRKSGAEFPAEANIAKFEQAGQLYFAVFMRDISRRKQVEEYLAKWAQVFENAEWGIVVNEAGSQTLQLMNPAFARLYGYSVDELTGKPVQDIYPPEDRHMVPIYIATAHREGHVTFEARHMRKDGTIFPAQVDITAVKDDSGKVLYRVVNVQDITERKNAERALMESERRNASIIASLDEGVILVDRTGTILAFNSSAEKITGVQQNQALGKKINQFAWQIYHEDGTLFTPETLPPMVSLKTGKACRNITAGFQKPGGATIWVSMNTQPLFHTDESRPYAVLSSFSDITERLQIYRLMEERVKESTREISALLDVSRQLASTLELETLLKTILEQLKNVVDFSGAAIVGLEKGEFVILEYLGPVAREKMVGFRVDAEIDTAYKRVALSRQPYIIADMWENTPWLVGLQKMAENGMREALKPYHSWMGVPMIAQKQLVGVLRIDHSLPGFYSERHALLVMAFADQAAMAIRNAELYGQAQSLAAFEERQRLARELHDSVSQALYGIALGTRTARTLLDRDPAQAVEPLEYCLSLAEAGLAEMRALIFELRPDSLEREGLVSALAKLTAALKARHSIQVVTEFGDEPQAPLAIKEVFYRVGQEALNNVAKHAGASDVNVKLSHFEGMLELAISDNGKGFDTQAKYPGHLGLTSMCERAERIGAEFKITSEPQKGTRVELKVQV